MTRIRAAGLAALILPVLLVGIACSAKDEAQPASGHASEQPASQQPGSPGSAVPASQAPGLPAADVVRLAQPSIVRIESAAGIGSGFIISRDGYVVTNNHVVTNSRGQRLSSVNVGLADGTTLTGTVVGGDERSDLAVVKVDGGPFAALELADIDSVEVGEDVLAIGYPLDLKGGDGASFSVTRGIISAKNRAIDESSQVLGAIQTDAAINHGNSGGPLLDLTGRVVGVNTALAPDTTTGGPASGIGFAVGSNLIGAVYEQLKDTGRVNRGFLGVSAFQSLRPARARDLGLPADTRGVFLDGAESVVAGGPAEAAGIRQGDVIAAIGGDPVRNETDLAVAMVTHAPGSQVDLAVYRGGTKVTVSVTLGEPRT